MTDALAHLRFKLRPEDVASIENGLEHPVDVERTRHKIKTETLWITPNYVAIDSGSTGIDMYPREEIENIDVVAPSSNKIRFVDSVAEVDHD